MTTAKDKFVWLCNEIIARFDELSPAATQFPDIASFVAQLEATARDLFPVLPAPLTIESQTVADDEDSAREVMTEILTHRDPGKAACGAAVPLDEFTYTIAEVSRERNGPAGNGEVLRYKPEYITLVRDAVKRAMRRWIRFAASLPDGNKAGGGPPVKHIKVKKWQLAQAYRVESKTIGRWCKKPGKLPLLKVPGKADKDLELDASKLPVEVREALTMICALDTLEDVALQTDTTGQIRGPNTSETDASRHLTGAKPL